jgi:hypothetical protein
VQEAETPGFLRDFAVRCYLADAIAIAEFYLRPAAALDLSVVLLKADYQR